MTVAITRLHITPFTPALLPAIFGPSLLEAAQNISYHHIQTFPEKAYGYVDLPSMDAEKVKRKLNGATLKGQKLKIDEAIPKKRKHDEDNETSQGRTENVSGEDSVPKRRKRKSKDGGGLLPGREVSPGRKVKRGWTELENKPLGKSKGKSGRQSTKYSEHEELLFRTQVPPNKMELASKEKKKPTNNADRHVIHEFERSTAQPSFLKGSTENGVRQDLHYVDGQGWMDEQGNVVEQASKKVSTKKANTGQASKTVMSRSSNKIAASNKSENSSASTSDEPADQSKPSSLHVEETSISGSSDGSTASSDSDDGNQEAGAQPIAQSNLQGTHPLEALFKKPTKPSSQDIAKPSLEVSTTFSFFEAGDEGDTGEEIHVPGTPFTSQDFRARGLRSAAPTPDTAHPSRFNSYGTPEIDESVDGGDQAMQRGSSEIEATPSQRKSRDETQQTEFEKQFWDQRGDNNRAWKARRRTVLKEKRQRENRARRPKNW